MSKEQNIVIIAGYQAVEPATKNFDALVQLVKDKKIKTDGMILVQKDKDGKITVSETGDHAGRKGAAWGGGVGLLVGLVAPVLLAPVVVGAAAGALVGRFARHKVESGVESGLGEKLKPGMAAILAIVREGDRLAANRRWPTPQPSQWLSSTKASRTHWPRPPASSIPTAPCCRSPIAPSAGRSAARSTPPWPTGR